MRRTDAPSPTTKKRPRLLAAVGVAALAVGLLAVGLLAASPAQAAVPKLNGEACYTGDVVVERWTDPRSNVRFTTTPAEETAARSAGFTPSGQAFWAFTTPPTGSGSWKVVPAIEGYQASNKDTVYIAYQGEMDKAKAYGFVDNGPAFYSLQVPMADCASQVRLIRGGKGAIHTVSWNLPEHQAKAAQGWTASPDYDWFAPSAPSRLTGTTPPPVIPPRDADGKFAIAVFPDTQQEVFAPGARMTSRADWIIGNAARLDLRFLGHTGDVVNWDTDDHAQYLIAGAAMDRIAATGLPMSLSIGNHDTMATGPGGGARDATRTREYQRTTTSFNTWLDQAETSAGFVPFEAGKVDNNYVTFSAGGAKFLVLTLELWPRESAVQWARGVIAGNPTHNVIVQSHSIFDGNCSITSAGSDVQRYQYGDSSPQRLWNQVVAPYPNVKVVTSGHVGAACQKEYTGSSGNKIAAYLQTFHSNTTNPIRIIDVDVNAGTLSSYVYGPYTNETIVGASTISGLSFIKG